MTTLTRQGVRDLDGPRNGRRRCTHRWEFATRIETIVEDGSPHDIKVRGQRCAHCADWRSE